MSTSETFQQLALHFTDPTQHDYEVMRCILTPYASPQLDFWGLDDEQWLKIARRPYERHRALRQGDARQLLLFDAVGAVL